MLSYSLHDFAAIRRSVILVVVTLLSLQCQRSIAGFVLATTTDGSEGVFQVVAAEQSVDIPIYLVQTNGEDRLNQVGLFAAGATVQIESGPGKATFGSAQVSSHWEDTFTSNTRFHLASNSVRLQGLMENNALFATGNAIQIGSFRVIGGDAGTTTALTISLQGLVADANLLFDFTSIEQNATDPSNQLTFAGASIQTITVVPEPSSIGLCLVGLGLLQLGRRRISKYRHSQVRGSE